jgi:phosphate transport system protein
MGIIAQEMLRDSIRCFVEYDADLAIDVIARDKTVDSIYKGFVRDITTLMTKDSKAICRALHLLTVSKAIERVADHATNIAEEVYYFLKGQDIRHDPFAGKNGGMD